MVYANIFSKLSVYDIGMLANMMAHTHFSSGQMFFYFSLWQIKTNISKQARNQSYSPGSS